MITFLGIYRGRSVGEAQLVAVSADPELVEFATSRLLAAPAPSSGDSVADALTQGRRRALEMIRAERRHDPD
jgi:hypothetical protein